MRSTWGMVVLALVISAGCGGKKTDNGKTPSCGDGEVQAGEACDQGADNSDTRPGACRTSCQPARCGDGVVDPGEACDDGNTVETDSCTSSCKAPTCGDGVQQTGEECDHGADNSDTVADACRTNCLNARCGDSVKDAGEACDDGNTVNDDSCSNTCKEAACGDGIVQTGEECDHGTDNSDTAADACRTTCKAHSCGDGVVDTGEGCDDAGTNSDTAPGACRTTCQPAGCGDAVIDPGEACDDGNQVNDDSCTNACQTPRCGDGIVQGGEACDHGADNSDTAPDACRTTCVLPRCGDSIKDGGEGCDDGNDVDTDACLTGCIAATCGDGFVREGVELCDQGAANSNTAPDACRKTCKPASCGDGVIDSGEVCDDGNLVDSDTCTTQCQPAVCGDGIVEVGFEECDSGANNSDTAAGACRTSCRKATCGDSVVDPGERCDDGNTVDTDTCTAKCQPAACGDGIVEDGVEACDEGNANSDTDPDACRTSCQLASCGDGVPDTNESCDDGNGDDNDGCSAKCALEVLDPGESVVVSLTIDGDSSKWGRPDENCSDVGNGANYPYHAFPFVNDTGHTLQVEFDSRNDSGNAYVIAYSPFDPNQPGKNCLALGDDVPDPDTGQIGSNHDQISVTMAAGDSVVVVVTSIFARVPLNNLGTVTVTAQSSICGNGDVELLEECDDGNQDDGDGCSSSCVVEPVCGNGVREGKEGCDDGNLDDGDGCSMTCTPDFPGHGHEAILTGLVTGLSNTFTRPEVDCSEGQVFAAYEEQTLTNDTGEDQTVRVEAIWSPKVDDHDGFVLAYVGDFSPDDPTTNCASGGDDFDWDLDTFSTDGGTDGSRTRVFTVGDGETLHVVATSQNDGNIIGRYKLYVENTAVSVKESEDNGTSDVANAVQGADVLQATIEADGDLDVFAFPAVKGGIYRVETSSGKLGSCSKGDDTALVVYDTDGATTLAKADDGIDSSPCASLIFQPPADGTYFVEVRASDGTSSIDPYFLEVRRR